MGGPHEEPETETWKILRKALLSAICDTGGTLHQPLGIWLPSNRSWQYQYSYADRAMYRFRATKWHKHEYVKHTRQVYKVEKESTVSLFHPDAVPITDAIKRPMQYVFTTPAGAQSNVKDPPNDPETFEEYLSQLPAWETSLLSCLTEEKVSITAHTLKQHLEQATNLYLVSDGGATEGHGYFGWVIATESIILWNGKGRVQINPNLMESLRTESVGLLSLTRFVHHYSNYYNMNLNQATTYHYCDNSTVVRRMQWYAAARDIETPNHSLSPDNDLQVQIEATLRDLRAATSHLRGYEGIKIIFREKNCHRKRY
eukprot:scaffold68115_cov70-Attheya_sp.AAC.3